MASFSVSNLVEALEVFPPYYHAIGCAADDVTELLEPELPASLQSLDRQGYVSFDRDQKTFRLEIFPDRGVARVSRAGTPLVVDSTAHGAASSGLVRAAVRAAERAKGVDLGEVLLALLIGPLLGDTGSRRVFTIAYDRPASEWIAYDGGLIRWMQKQFLITADTAHDGSFEAIHRG